MRSLQLSGGLFILIVVIVSVIVLIIKEYSATTMTAASLSSNLQPVQLIAKPRLGNFAFREDSASNSVEPLNEPVTAVLVQESIDPEVPEAKTSVSFELRDSAFAFYGKLLPNEIASLEISAPVSLIKGPLVASEPATESSSVPDSVTSTANSKCSGPYCFIVTSNRALVRKLRRKLLRTPGFYTGASFHVVSLSAGPSYKVSLSLSRSSGGVALSSDGWKSLYYTDSSVPFEAFETGLLSKFSLRGRELPASS